MSKPDRHIQIVKIFLIILTLITTISAEPVSLIDLLEANKINYIILPDTNEPVYISRTGKITTATSQKTTISTQTSAQHINTTDITTTILDQTIYILEPVINPSDIVIETNKINTDIKSILKTIPVIYNWEGTTLIIKRKWRLKNIQTYNEETGTYEELLQKAITEINKKEQPKPLKTYYTLIPAPDLTKLCIITNIECYQLTEDMFLIDNPEPVRTYIRETRPRIHIQAYILLLTKTAKNQLSLELSLFPSRIITPPLTEKESSIITNIKNIDIQLQALAEKNQASIIASPSLLLDDRQTASIRQGYEIPVITPGTPTTPPTATYRNAYLSLTVQPILLPTNQIRISLTLTKDSPDFSYNIASNVPIQTNAIETTITIQPDNPILIGGIEEQTKTNKTGLGFIFFNKEKEDTKRELYILLIARLVD